MSSPFPSGAMLIEQYNTRMKSDKSSLDNLMQSNAADIEVI